MTTFPLVLARFGTHATAQSDEMKKSGLKPKDNSSPSAMLGRSRPRNGTPINPSISMSANLRTLSMISGCPPGAARHPSIQPAKPRSPLIDDYKEAPRTGASFMFYASEAITRRRIPANFSRDRDASEVFQLAPWRIHARRDPAPPWRVFETAAQQARVGRP